MYQRNDSSFVSALCMTKKTVLRLTMSLVRFTVRKYTPNPIQHSGYKSLAVRNLCFLFFFFALSPLQNIVTSLSLLSFPSSFLFSSLFLLPLPSVLSFQISTPLSSSLAVKTCRGQLWRDKGMDMDGSPRQHGQAQRKARQPQCPCAKQLLISTPCLPALNTEPREGIKHKTTMQLMFIHIQALSLSLSSPPVFPSHVHSPPLFFLVSLSSPLPVYSSQFVNRSLLMWFAVCISSAFTAPSFLPPRLPALPLPLGRLSFSFHTQPPPSSAAASYYWSSCRADGRLADVETGMRGGYAMIVLMDCCCLHQLSFTEALLKDHSPDWCWTLICLPQGFATDWAKQATAPLALDSAQACVAVSLWQFSSLQICLLIL